MEHSKFQAILKRSRFWADIAFLAVCVSLMVLILSVGYVWHPESLKMLEQFRDPNLAVGDDWRYGAIVGTLFGIFFQLPTALIPLLAIVQVDRKLGVACPQCNASLTLWRRGAHVLECGTCCKCEAVVTATPHNAWRQYCGGTQ